MRRAGLRWARPVLAGIGVTCLLGCASTAPRTDDAAVAAAAGPVAPEARPEAAPAAAPTTGAPAGDATDGDWMETVRGAVRGATVWTARRVDSWFGDEPFEEGQRVTNGRLSLDLLWRESESVEPRLRLGARVRLPNLERRAYLFVGRDNEREVIADVPGELSRQERLQPEPREDRSFFVGLGAQLARAVDFRVGFSARQKLYAQLRYRRVWPLSARDRLDFRETVYTNIDDRLGSTTTFSYERDLASALLLRWASGTTITQRSRRFDWYSTPALYRSFGTDRVLTLEAPFEGAEREGLLQYSVQVRWQQPVLREWLIGEIGLGRFWPLDESGRRSGRWALIGAVGMRF